MGGGRGGGGVGVFGIAARSRQQLFGSGIKRGVCNLLFGSAVCFGIR